MKYLITTIAALVLMGCGESQQSVPAPESKTAATAKAPKISIWRATADGNIEVVKQSITDGEDVNAKNVDGLTPLHLVEKKEIAELLVAKGAELNPIDNFFKYTPLDFMEGEVGQDTINFLRKHGGKTGEELKSSGN